MNAGIYRITCLANKRSYIGSSIDLSKRWQRHKQALRRGDHRNRHLQRAWNKYGADSFMFEVLLYCDPKDCLMHEQIALDQFEPRFNICQQATNSLGVKRSDETRRRISNSKKGIPIHTESSKRKIRDCHLGKITSQLTKIKMSQSRVGRNVIDLIRSFITNGARDCDIARELDIHPSTVNKIRHGKRHG